MLDAIYEKVGVFKYPVVFQCDNAPEFKSDLAKLLEKQNFDIQRTKLKRKHTYTAFVVEFNKELAKTVLSLWMLKSFKTLKKFQQFELNI